MEDLNAVPEEAVAPPTEAQDIVQDHPAPVVITTIGGGLQVGSVSLPSTVLGLTKLHPGQDLENRRKKKNENLTSSTKM